MCVQRFDDSLNSAIHITYRISLRSSSMPEPRDPLLKVLYNLYGTQTTLINRVWVSSDGHTPTEASGGTHALRSAKATGSYKHGVESRS